MNIDLVYLSDNLYGGWVTFTRHLHDSLQMAGANVRIVKVRPNCGDGRNFGYGLTYAARTVGALKLERSVKLIVALHKKYATAAEELLTNKRNAVVLHDYNELKHLPANLRRRVVVIRKINLPLVPGSVFIPHPYVRAGANDVPSAGGKPVHARSVCRIDHDKNTTMLLDANRLLGRTKQIDIRGFENRIYTRFTVMPKYPEWVQSKAHFPREKHAAYDLLLPVRYMVDLSVIKNDGGGTQYSFLEAIDAGAACVIHTNWCNVKGEMRPGYNCFTAGTAEELVKVLRYTHEEERLAVAVNARKLLNSFHSPSGIAQRYLEFLQ